METVSCGQWRFTLWGNAFCIHTNPQCLWLNEAVSVSAALFSVYSSGQAMLGGETWQIVFKNKTKSSHLAAEYIYIVK